MKKLTVTDCAEVEEGIALDEFYPDPELCQQKSRQIFARLFTKDLNFYSPEGLFYTTINRYFLTEIKILEHPLLVENIRAYCHKHGVGDVHFILHASNKPLFDFYSRVLNQSNIRTAFNQHQNSSFWTNSLTAEPWREALTNRFKVAFTILAQFGMLLLNFLNPFKAGHYASKVLLWHSFANNRQKVDYKFLDKLAEDPELTVVHPNPYTYRRKSAWDVPIYFMGRYSIDPFRYLKVAVHFFAFRPRFNQIIDGFQEFVPHNPRVWNTKTMTRTTYFLLYNLLSGGLIENFTRAKRHKVINVFRGGSAAGLIYSGMCKKRYANDQVTNILATHGTEFNPIDHFSYFYLDYNVLPSELIRRNWEKSLKRDYQPLLRYNQCQLVTGGRVDYKLLQEDVHRKPFQPNAFYVGIVLTYNSQAFQETYISSVIRSFEQTFPDTECHFVIKPRPNRPYVPNAFVRNKPNVHVCREDIFGFLNGIDLVVGTVSTYGVLTMVVTDAMLRDIPGIYYLMNERFDGPNLGYSYHESMAPYTFKSVDDLTAFVNTFRSPAEALQEIKRRNAHTKEYLEYERDPEVYLEELFSRV